MVKTALAFSGGKDSWACLWMYADKLADITVMWVNTGKNYPELLEGVEKARSMCPKFVEIKSDQAGQTAANGLPADVVPVQWSKQGMIFSGRKPVMVQSYLDCCANNISAPLHQAILAHGITHVIRGQRLDELHQSPAQHGALIDGITYLHPIETWTTQEVLDYVAQHMPLPEHFALKHSSMDCYDCTGFRQETTDRVAYTALRHPHLHEAHQRRARAVDFAISQALK